MTTLANLLPTLISDRTQADVDRVKELNIKLLQGAETEAEYLEWVAGLKGAYNASDLNRVSETTERLGEHMRTRENALINYRNTYQIGSSAYNDLPYAPADVVTHSKYDWTMEDIPSYEQGQNYVGDIRCLRDCISPLLSASAPEVPDINFLTYEGANDLEELLQTIYGAVETAFAEKADILVRSRKSLDYTGMLTCGGI